VSAASKLTTSISRCPVSCLAGRISLAYSHAESGWCTQSPAFRLRSSLSGLPAFTSSPRRAAFIAATVSELGLSGSNGSAFSAATRNQQQAKGVGHGETDFLQRRSGLPLGACINGARTTEFSVMALFPLSYIVAQRPEMSCPALPCSPARWVRYTLTSMRKQISPATSVSGAVQLPGDKSISHRYAMLASIAEGPDQNIELFNRRRLPIDARLHARLGRRK